MGRQAIDESCQHLTFPSINLLEHLSLTATSLLDAIILGHLAVYHSKFSHQASRLSGCKFSSFEMQKPVDFFGVSGTSWTISIHFSFTIS